MDECVFCKIGRFEEVERGKVLVDGLSFYIMEPLNPVAEGHVLVIPRAHVSSAVDDPAVASEVMNWAATYAQGVGDCNIITSVGPLASQTVFHLHVHVVPRREGDGLALPWGKVGPAKGVEGNSDWPSYDYGKREASL